MKKFLILIICCSLGFAIAGCGKKPAEIKPLVLPVKNNDAKIINENDVVNNFPEATESGLRDYNIATARYNFSFSYPVSYPGPKMVNNSIPSDGSYLAETANWRLNIGPLAKGGCEGADCYLLYFEGYPSKDYDKTLREIKRNQTITGIEERLINGVQAVVYTEGGICNYQRTLLFNKYLTIKYTAWCGADSNSLAAVFYQILDTFKFNEAPLADWQELSSPELNISLLYPPDWTLDRLNAESGAADAGGTKLRLCNKNVHAECEYNLTIDTTGSEAASQYFDPDTSIISSKIIGLSGLDATEHEYRGPLGNWHSIIILDSAKNQYSINYSFADEAELAIIKNILSQFNLIKK